MAICQNSSIWCPFQLAQPLTKDGREVSEPRGQHSPALLLVSMAAQLSCAILAALCRQMQVSRLTRPHQTHIPLSPWGGQCGGHPYVPYPGSTWLSIPAGLCRWWLCRIQLPHTHLRPWNPAWWPAHWELPFLAAIPTSLSPKEASRWGSGHAGNWWQLSEYTARVQCVAESADQPVLPGTEATEQTCPHLPKTVAAGSHLLLTRHTRVAEKIAETTEKT